MQSTGSAKHLVQTNPCSVSCCCLLIFLIVRSPFFKLSFAFTHSGRNRHAPLHFSSRFPLRDALTARAQSADPFLRQLCPLRRYLKSGKINSKFFGQALSEVSVVPGVKETYSNEGQHEEVNRQSAQTLLSFFFFFFFSRWRKTS